MERKAEDTLRGIVNMVNPRYESWWWECTVPQYLTNVTYPVGHKFIPMLTALFMLSLMFLRIFSIWGTFRYKLHIPLYQQNILSRESMCRPPPLPSVRHSCPSWVEPARRLCAVFPQNYGPAFLPPLQCLRIPSANSRFCWPALGLKSD